MDDWADSVIKQANMISKPEKQPELKMQTEYFQCTEQGTSTSKAKTHDVQTMKFEAELQKDLKCSIDSLLSVLKLSQQLVQQTQTERNMVTKMIVHQKHQQIQETSVLQLNMRSFLQRSYNPQDLFYFYSQNKLNVYFTSQENSQYLQTYFYPNHQIERISESLAIFSANVRDITCYRQFKQNQNIFLFGTADGLIGYNLMSLMQKNDFQPPYSIKENLHSGPIIYIEFLKFSHLKNFWIISVSTLGRILIHEFADDKFELKGGCCMKHTKAAMQVGRAITSASLANISGNTASLFLGSEDGNIQLIQVFMSRSQLPVISNFQQLSEGNTYKIVRAVTVKPGFNKVCTLDQQLIENQQSFAKIMLNQCCFSLDGQGQLQLITANKVAVRYYAEQPILDFAHFDRFLVGVTETQILLYQIFEQQPVQLSCAEYKLQIRFNQIEVLQYNSQLVMLMVVDEQRVDYHLVQILLPFSLVTLNEFGKALYTGLQFASD